MLEASAEIALLAWPLPLGALGSTSSTVEAIATSIGAGVLLGGFMAGTAQRLARLRRGQRVDDEVVVDAGYGGGWVSVLALLLDFMR